MTFPRTQDFAQLSGTVPSDGALLLPGVFATSDAGTNGVGQLKEYARGDVGLELISATATAASWWLYLWTPTNGADVAVEANVYYARVKQSSTTVRAGVCARASGSFSTSATGGVERWWNASGYTLELLINPANGTGALSLNRYNGGTGTVLATSGVLTLIESRTIELELLVADVAGNPVLIGNMNGAQIITHTDSAAGKITANGYAGFLTEHSTNGSQSDRTRTGVRGFEIGVPALDIKQLVDDFKRPNRAGADEIRLRQVWHDPTLVEASGGQISFSGTADTEQIALYQVAPRSAQYNVSVDTSLPNTTAAHRVGVVARASKSTATGGTTGFSGYAAFVIGNADELHFEKWVGGVRRTNQDIGWEIFPLTLNTSTNEFRLDVSDDPDGTVRVVIRYAGAIVATVLDPYEDAHRSAGQAGIYGLRDSGGAGALVFDNFALDDPDPGTPAFASVALRGEEVDVDAPTPAPFVSGQVEATGGTDTLVIPHQALSASDVAVWDAATRLVTITAGTPAVSEVKPTVGSGTTSVQLGYTPTAGELFRFEVRVNASSAMRLNTTLTGTQNGSNTSFTLTQTPVSPEKVRIVTDGYELLYTTDNPVPSPSYFRHVSGDTYELGYGPASSEVLRADVEIAGAVTNDLEFRETPTKITATQFQLANVPRSGQVGVTVSGARLGAGEFTVGGSLLTIAGQLDADPLPIVDYIPADFSELVLNLTPSLTYTETESVPARVERFALGYTQRSAIRTRSRRRFTCRWEYIDQGTRDTLANFFRARFGPVEQFEWTPPDRVSPVLVHLADVEFDDELRDAGVYSVRAELEELFR